MIRTSGSPAASRMARAVSARAPGLRCPAVRPSRAHGPGPAGRDAYPLFGVVGIHQERHRTGVGPGEGPEGRLLCSERLDVRVGHRADGRESFGGGRGDVARSGESDHGAQPGGLETGLRAVRAAQGEVHDRMAGSGQDAPCGFRGDRRRVVDLVEDVRLDQLGLRERSSHLQHRLSRQDDPPLRHRPHQAGELHAQQRGQITRRPVQC